MWNCPSPVKIIVKLAGVESMKSYLQAAIHDLIIYGPHYPFVERLTKMIRCEYLNHRFFRFFSNAQDFAQEHDGFRQELTATDPINR